MTRKNSENVLLPCPFCGEKAEYKCQAEYEEEQLPNEYDIQCKTTGCYLEFGGGWYASQKDVTNKWNNRPSPWVRCEDKLPEEGIVVNVACERPSLERFADVGVINDGFWYYAYTNQKILVAGGVAVTHWMPLPEPPSDGGKDE